MDTKLDKKISFQIASSVSVDIESYETIIIYDNRKEKVVTASVKIPTQPGYLSLTLWAGADYDAIGQWTDSDADTKIANLLK